MNVTSGTRLGPYEIVAPIGVGGMGEVFKARDTRLDRSVAIKVLPREFSQNAQLRLRFEREAKAISQLSHPHICTLHDVGSENGISYLVLELLEGETLAERLTRGAMPVAEVLRVGAQIGDALANAHRRGVIHRDLKPGNIMLTRSGAKLLDFGLAKTGSVVSTSGDSVAFGATEHKPLTEQGTILGTFQYMAPEQLEGEEADARTDIFALGGVLYEMATGQRAFSGKNKTSLIAAIVSGEPRALRELQPMTPPAFEHVVARCLMKDREQRWQSAQDVAEELRWIIAGESRPDASRHAPAKKSRERWLWATAVVLATIAAVTVTTLLRPPQPALSYRFTLPQRDGGYSRATWPLLSPDGKRVVFVATDGAGKRRLFVRSLDDFAVKTMDLPAGPLGTGFWSADSKTVAFVGGGKLRRVDIETGRAQVIADIGQGVDGAWNDDGTILVGNIEGPLLQVSKTGGQPIALTTPDVKTFELGHHAPLFLPDGRRFLFITFTRNPARPDAPHTLYAGEMGSKDIRKIGEVTSKVAYARGYLFYVRRGTLLAVPFDERQLEMKGEPVVVADGVGNFQPTGSANFSVARDGTIAWSPRPEPDRVVITDREGRVMQTVVERVDMRHRFAVSNDGTLLVAAKRDLAIGTFDLWTYGLTRPTTSRLTFDSSEERDPVLSADEQSVYFGSDRGGLPAIYVKRFDGSGADRLVLNAPGEQTPTSASPDGQYLLYTDIGASASPDVMCLSLRDGRSFPIARTPAVEAAAKFSPDGRSIAFVADSSGRPEVYLKPFAGTAGVARQVSTSGGVDPGWSRDGRTLYYLHESHTVMAADVDAAGATSEPRAIYKSDLQISSFAPLPDGRLLLNLTDEEEASPSARVVLRWPDALQK